MNASLLVLHQLELWTRDALLMGVGLALARAFWEGARQEVVRFGADVSAVVFARLRRLLRMRP